MQLEHHDLDIRPIPEEKEPLFINEPWLIDDSIYESMWGKKEPENTDDNIRVYVPLDINRQAILRRLERIITRYGEANEENEFSFSAEAIGLVKAFISKLEDIPDGCAELFPFELMYELTEEFLGRTTTEDIS